MAEGFAESYRSAGHVLEDPHCLAYEVARGWRSRRFVVRIEWDSVERHEQGFRASSRLGEFFSAVRPFYAGIDEMKHYAVQDRGQPG